MKYLWRAFLDDGSVVCPPRSSDEIDRYRCVRFILYDPSTTDVIASIQLNPPDERLVYRVRKTMSAGGGVTGVCHLVGKRTTNNDEVVWIVEGGGIYLTHGYDNEHGLFYPPVFTDQELFSE